MESSKLALAFQISFVFFIFLSIFSRLIYQNLFIFIIIFASISQKSVEKHYIFASLRFSWKFRYNPILGWRVQKSNSFPQLLSSSSFIMKIDQKWVQFSFLRFLWKFILLSKFQVESSKIVLTFWNFFIFIFIFPQSKISEKPVKFLSLKFSWKVMHNLILTWRVQKFPIFLHLHFCFCLN